MVFDELGFLKSNISRIFQILLPQFKILLFVFTPYFSFFLDTFIQRGVCSKEAPYCLIMEFCAFGQLYDALRNEKEVSPSLLITWARGIAEGMSYLHSNRIIHRDLKSPK